MLCLPGVVFLTDMLSGVDDSYVISPAAGFGRRLVYGLGVRLAFTAATPHVVSVPDLRSMVVDLLAARGREAWVVQSYNVNDILSTV